MVSDDLGEGGGGGISHGRSSRCKTTPCIFRWPSLARVPDACVCRWVFFSTTNHFTFQNPRYTRIVSLTLYHNKYSCTTCRVVYSVRRKLYVGVHCTTSLNPYIIFMEYNLSIVYIAPPVYMTQLYVELILVYMHTYTSVCIYPYVYIYIFIYQYYHPVWSVSYR